MLVEGEAREDRFDPRAIFAEADQLVHAEPDHLVIEEELAARGRDDAPRREAARGRSRARAQRPGDRAARAGRRARARPPAREPRIRASLRAPTRNRSRTAPRTATGGSRGCVASIPPVTGAAHDRTARHARQPASASRAPVKRARFFGSKSSISGGSRGDRPEGASVKAKGFGWALLGALLGYVGDPRLREAAAGRRRTPPGTREDVVLARVGDEVVTAEDLGFVPVWAKPSDRLESLVTRKLAAEEARRRGLAEVPKTPRGDREISPQAGDVRKRDCCATPCTTRFASASRSARRICAPTSRRRSDRLRRAAVEAAHSKIRERGRGSNRDRGSRRDGASGSRAERDRSVRFPPGSFRPTCCPSCPS